MSTSDKPAAAAEPDIEAQLDELLSQLMEHEPGVVAPAASGAIAVTASDAIDPHEASQVALSEDELASQIQAMLDDARQAETASPPPPEVTADERMPAAAMATTDTTLSVSEALAQTLAEDESSERDVPIHAIDEMLAEAADDAVAGEFETVEEVLSASSAAMGSSVTAQPVGEASPKASSRSSMLTPAPAGDDDDDAVQGHFQTPEELLRASHAAGAPDDADSTTLAQVMTGRAAADSEMSQRTPTAAHARRDLQSETSPLPKAPTVHGRTLVTRCDRSLRRVLGTVNRPLDAVSPSLRSAIGWLGVVTFFNGSALLMWTAMH